MKTERICPVCGYPDLEEVPYDEYGYPSHEICSCCGFEFGFDDSSEGFTFDEYRKEWILEGFKYRWVEYKPKDWGEEALKKQLKNIELVNYKPRI